MAIILWCVVSTILVALEAGPIAGVLVVLPCVLLAPGLVVVLLLRLPGLALTSTVVLLVGLALGVLVPAVFLYTGTWSPHGAFAVIAAGTVLGASAGIISDAQRSGRGRSTPVPTSRRGDPVESDFVVLHHRGGTTEHAAGPVRVAGPIAERVVVPPRSAPGAAATAARPAGAGAPPTPPVDLNTATLEQLIALPGIGPLTAQKILDFRQAIDDAIAAAGGPTAQAQLDAVNLAAPIADAEQVVAPARGVPGAAAAAASPAGAGSSPTPSVDLNTASLEQLIALPGIRPPTAQKILDFRQAIDDAIAAAGGPSAKDTVNLAAPIADAEQVVVPARGVAGAAAAAASLAPVGPSPAPPVDLNTATLEQLEALPGVGPVTAQKILDFRRAHGPFHSVTGLQAVPGIGPAHLAKLKGLVIT